MPLSIQPWFLRSADCAVLRFTGADRHELLQRLSTNECVQLRPRDVQATILTTVKGKVLDLLQLFVREDDMLALCGAERVADVTAHINRYTITEDVRVDDVSADYAVYMIRDDGASTDTSHGWVHESVGGCSVMRADKTFIGGNSVTVIVDATSRAAIETTWHERGLREGRPADLTAMRIAGRIPGWGTELTSQYNPLECGAEATVSFTKGCYLGQEVIARLHAYKKVQRGLALITWSPGTGISAPLSLTVDGTVIGDVTTVGETADGPRGLAIIRREQIIAGRVCTTRDGTAVTILGA